MVICLNLRARDLPCTPLAVAYALVTSNACTLFVAPGRLSDADAATLAESGVTVRGYNDLLDAVSQVDAGEVFLVDEAATNYDLYTALSAYKTVAGTDPIFALKGVKNAVELQNIRECHIRDGVAVVRFEMDLEKFLAEGKELYETDIEKMLIKRRAEQPGYLEESFPAIAAWGPNAAMMHYHAEGEVNSKIERKGFLLVDNGGQYDCGTTDITRTYPVGPLTDDERKYYTWTLQSHIEMARAVFLDYLHPVLPWVFYVQLCPPWSAVGPQASTIAAAPAMAWALSRAYTKAPRACGPTTRWSSNRA